MEYTCDYENVHRFEVMTLNTFSKHQVWHQSSRKWYHKVYLSVPRMRLDILVLPSDCDIFMIVL